ncbi:uncharacterized protein N7482_005322 [Penicillium canariense]|uniref:Bromo domain-containing protein n=1 Tax=Penicillium canariense TaxID=189055 RepID=A0A9W9LMX1_9EURO|nr:uncharacterized protein N7482_005322 [Penicillium canariense]KAJ5166541.1 hypothetical protein N7482_005322 [Penicillium canariense]
MSTKRRGTAASPDVRVRGQKRRKVSEDSPVDPEDSNQTPSQEDSDPADEAQAEGSSIAQEEDEETEADFEGDDLQTAQDKIMTELTRLKDSDGEEVAYPFIGKPDRNLYRDYYEVIQHPVSLRTIQKQVRGTDSRKKPSKSTAFSTWQSFEEEVAYIWQNAREYNEDGSEISMLAGDYFKRRVAEAKKHVPDPTQVDGHPEMPRIKLKMGARNPEPRAQRLTLKMAGQTSEPPSKDDGPPSGVTVDNESLKRQQELVRTGSASQEIDAHRTSPRTRSLRGHVVSPGRSSVATTPSALEQPQNGPAGGRDGPPVIKHEASGAASQPPETRTLNGLHGVPLEATDGKLHHEMSDPDRRVVADPSLHHIASIQQSISASPLDSLWRRPGQDASSALIRNVQILTHPSLSLQHDLRLDIPPSPTLSQQSITINLPASHHLLTVRPTLVAGTAKRQVKIVALVGLQRLHSTGDTSALAYDIPLHPGTTKVDLEAIAGPARGVPKSGPPGSEIDYERVTIFFNLLR